MEIRRLTICGRSLLGPTENLCTPADCGAVRNTSRAGTQSRGHELCVALNGWQVAGKKPATHPAGLADDLPRLPPGGGWSAVIGALQLAEFLEEDGPRLMPASYVTTGSHQTLEHMVRTHGRSPTSSFLLCSLFSDVLDLPQEAYLDFPRTREREAATPTTVNVLPRTPSDHGTSAPAPKSEALHRTARPRVSGRPPRRMGGKALPGGPSGFETRRWHDMRCLFFR